MIILCELMILSILFIISSKLLNPVSTPKQKIRTLSVRLPKNIFSITNIPEYFLVIMNPRPKIIPYIKNKMINIKNTFLNNL